MKAARLIGREASLDALIALTVAALVALSWLLVSQGGLTDPTPVRKHYPFVLGYAYLLLLLPPIFVGRRLSVASLLGGLVLAVFLAVDLTTLRFFDAPFLKLHHYLPVTASSASREVLAGYAFSYLPVSVCLLAGATVFVALAAAGLVRNRPRARLTIVLLLPVLFAGAFLSAANSARLLPQTAALINEKWEPLERLAGSDRSGNFGVSDSSHYEPETIILVVMESAGAATTSSDGARLLSEQIIESSRSERWVAFSNAVTNSNATDISVPSLLTGSAAHESAEKLHALPFQSQYAAARGYRTAFVTSSSMRWGGFEEFLAAAQMDDVVTASSSGQPFVNDLAVDDHFAFRTAAEMIEQTQGKLFLTLYPQALHWPFQTTSTFPIPVHMQDRRARATFVIEAGFRVLFEALRRTSRLDDALVIVVGDHGEFDYRSTLRMPRMRMDTFEEGILSPIFLIKAPLGMPAADFEILNANSNKLVANHDIAPTIADILNGELKKGLTYAGYSLIRKVPEDRIAFSTSVNEWRHWTKAAIAVSRGRERMTCDAANLCRLGRETSAGLATIRPADPDDELMKLAIGNVVMRKALGQVYRNHHE